MCLPVANLLANTLHRDTHVVRRARKMDEDKGARRGRGCSARTRVLGADWEAWPWRRGRPRQKEADLSVQPLQTRYRLATSNLGRGTDRADRADRG